MARSILISQYENVKDARHALFTYCKSIQHEHLFKNIEVFNNSSISYLLMHVANTYLHWLLFFDQGIPEQYFGNDGIFKLSDIEKVYQQVDVIVADFLLRYNNTYEQVFTKNTPRKGISVTTTPLQLFTHVITHEFHHKGQILTMSRILGYVPADTDVIRF